ncbi:hypothetical protein QYS48_33630 [Marivirga arenosa]|uniref:Pentapeptide repeat-containing protein n=1 Tax=Marivirga arenosa TaxID=3059076 RepID=A0AA51N5S1_9BACT|nr:hypothetical protein [Marivirga sp. ABR2-2]WMN06762.1 hypothetical protein QYS48_33630 [Marivirga sp. ABR2-2]
MDKRKLSAGEFIEELKNISKRNSGDVKMDNIIIEEPLSLIGIGMQSLSFEDCEISQLSISSEIRKSISLNGIKGEYIKITNLGCNLISLNSCTLNSLDIKKNFNGKLNIGPSNEVKDILFENIIPSGGEIYSKNKVVFSDCKLKELLKINTRELTFSNNSNIIKLEPEKSINILKFLDSSCGHLQTSQQGNLTISGENVNLTTLEINYDIGELNFLNSSLQKIKLEGHQTSLNKISLSNCRGLESFTCDGYFVNEFYVDRIVNYSKFEITHSNISDSLTMTDCDLSDAVFNDLNLSSCTCKFNRSFLVGANFFNIQWNEKEMIGKENKKDLQELRERKEVFRQLKYAHSKQENALDASFFKVQELESYRKLLSIIRTRNIRVLGDRLILWTHKVLGGYGVNVWVPFFWLFSAHLLWFCLSEFSPSIMNSADDFSWTNTKLAIVSYFYFLNPVHPFFYQGERIMSGWDILMRLSSGYFIFYFLKASRKFH